MSELQKVIKYAIIQWQSTITFAKYIDFGDETFKIIYLYVEKGELPQVFEKKCQNREHFNSYVKLARGKFVEEEEFNRRIAEYSIKIHEIIRRSQETIDLMHLLVQ